MDLRGCGATGTLIHGSGRLNSTNTWENLSSFFQVKYLPNEVHDPETPLLEIYPREIKTHAYKKSGTIMFTVALFIISPN